MVEPITPQDIINGFPVDQDSIDDLIGKVNRQLRDNWTELHTNGNMDIPKLPDNQFDNVPETKRIWLLHDVAVANAFVAAGWVITVVQASNPPTETIAIYNFELP